MKMRYHTFQVLLAPVLLNPTSTLDVVLQQTELTFSFSSRRLSGSFETLFTCTGGPLHLMRLDVRMSTIHQVPCPGHSQEQRKPSAGF